MHLGKFKRRAPLRGPAFSHKALTTSATLSPPGKPKEPRPPRAPSPPPGPPPAEAKPPAEPKEPKPPKAPPPGPKAEGRPAPWSDVPDVEFDPAVEPEEGLDVAPEDGPELDLGAGPEEQLEVAPEEGLEVAPDAAPAGSDVRLTGPPPALDGPEAATRPELKRPRYYGGHRPIKMPTNTLSAGRREAVEKPEVANLVPVGDPGVNDTFIATLGGGGYGVWKPQRGERLSLVRGVGGPLFVREIATYEVAELLGAADLVPVTGLRSLYGDEGSMQQLVPGAAAAAEAVAHLLADQAHLEWKPGMPIELLEGRRLGAELAMSSVFNGDEDLARAAALDYVMGQVDRHFKNWLVRADGRLALIDNGLCLLHEYNPEHDRWPLDPYHNAPLHAAARRGLPVPKEVEMWQRRADEVTTLLDQLGFHAKAVDGLRSRLAAVARADTFEELLARHRSR